MAAVRFFLVGSPVPDDVVLERLGALPVDNTAEVTVRRIEFYDTYDFRLWTGGYLLRREGDRWELASIDRPSLAGVSFERARPPRFAVDFRSHDLRRLMERLLGVRALVRICSVSESETTGFVAPGGPGTSSVRVRLSSWRAVEEPAEIPLLRVLSLFAEKTASVNALLSPACLETMASLGIAPVDDFRAPAAVLLGVGGRIPGAYARRFAVPLTPETPLDEATRLYFSRLVDVMEESREGILRDVDTEFLHDFRVAVRRMRTWLSIVGPCARGLEIERCRDLLRGLIDSTNALRDYDVLLLRLPGLAREVCSEIKKDVRAWRARVRSLRGAAWRATVRYFETRGPDETFAALRAFTLPASEDPSAGAPIRLGDLGVSYFSAAYKRFARRLKKVGKRGDGRDVHRLRLAVKKLRYGVEVFGNAFPAAGSLLDAAKDVQDLLGEANDISVGRLLLVEKAALICRGPADRGLRLAQVNGAFLQLLAAHEAKALKEARRAQRRLKRRMKKNMLPVFNKEGDLSAANPEEGRDDVVRQEEGHLGAGDVQ